MSNNNIETSQEYYMNNFIAKKEDLETENVIENEPNANSMGDNITGEMSDTNNLGLTDSNVENIDNTDHLTYLQTEFDSYKEKKMRNQKLSGLKKDETYILLEALKKYDCNDTNGNKSTQVKKWRSVLNEYNKRNVRGNICKQTRTLKSRYEKLVALYLQKNLSAINRLVHEKHFPLLQEIITSNNGQARPAKEVHLSFDENENSVLTHEENEQEEDLDDEIEDNKSDDDDIDDDLPLDSIKMLPRSSYLSKKEADAQAAASTESASPATTTLSPNYYMSQNGNQSTGNKKLSILYGAAMMGEENNSNYNGQSPESNGSAGNTSAYNASRDLEIQHLRESIVDIKNNILNLEKIFDRLNKKVDDLMK